MSKDQQHSPQHKDVLKKQSLEQHEVKEVLNLFKKYAVPALVVIVAVCGIFLFDRYLKNAKATKEVKADTILMTATSRDLYEKFGKKYGKHVMAAQAELNAITCMEALGNTDQAAQQYSDFARKHKDSYLAPAAMMGQARCLESAGKLEAAKQVYEDLMVSYKDSQWAGLAQTRELIIGSKLN